VLFTCKSPLFSFPALSARKRRLKSKTESPIIKPFFIQNIIIQEELCKPCHFRARVEKISSSGDNRSVITFDDFKRLDIRIGRITAAEKVEGTEKLLRLVIDLGTEQRQIVAGIAESYQPDQIIGKEIPLLLNLEPRKIRGVESQGMILAADVEGKAVLLHPEREVPRGSLVR